MAQAFQRPNEAITQIVREVAFAVNPGSPVRAFPISGQLDTPSVTQAPLDVMHQSVHLFDEQDPVYGPKEGAWKLPFYVCADSTQLASGATAATHDLGQMLKAAFGGETNSAGSTVAASPAATTTSLSVAPGDGSKFAVGQWVLVQVGGVLEPTKISAISTDALTFDLACSATPDTGGLVVNMWNNYFTPGSTESLSIDHALANLYATEQWALNGCIVDSMELKTDMSQILTASFGLKVGTWTYPGANISSVTTASPTASAPFVAKDALSILQAYSTTTRTQANLFSVGYKITTGMDYVRSHSGTDTKSGAMRTGARTMVEAEIALAGADETTIMGLWSAQTSVRFVYAVPRGATTTKQWTVVDIPKGIIRDKPNTVKEGGRVLTKFTVRGKMPSTATSGATATDLARSPLVIARG